MPELSYEQKFQFNEFIWRLMGRLDAQQWESMLDPSSPLGEAVRARYRALAEGDPDAGRPASADPAVDGSLFIA
jgi:hypothetical protein